MMYGSAQSVGAPKVATICGSMETYAVNAMRQGYLAEVVTPRKMYQSITMRMDTAQDIGAIPATKVTDTLTEKTGILIRPMQAKD